MQKIIFSTQNNIKYTAHILKCCSTPVTGLSKCDSTFMTEQVPIINELFSQSINQRLGNRMLDSQSALRSWNVNQSALSNQIASFIPQ